MTEEKDNPVIEEILKLPRDELAKLLFAYGDYVYQVVNENEGEPVCVEEFYENDYQEYVKGEEV